MTELLIDAIIYVLLFVGIMFGGIGIVGLLLFPDRRSRMFTGVRATLIASGAIMSAGIIYGLFAFFTRGGTQYSVFTIHVIVFFFEIFVLNIVAARTIMKKPVKEVQECTSIPGEKS